METISLTQHKLQTQLASPDLNVEKNMLPDTSSDEAISDGYQKAYNDLISRGGYSPRKAKRYLDSIAKRNVKTFMKRKKNNG